jgi:zinc protease
MRLTQAFSARTYLLVLAMLAGPFVAPLAAQKPLLTYERFVLPNGLTVVVHEDHKAPVVSVNIWYHVGSGNEVPGKTGFAHLFEHLMFGGSEHVKGEYIVAMQKAGATALNGSTTTDRTEFHETVPVASLDYALFVESDRMGHFVLNKDTLEMQRGVVQNEKRRGENQPYAVSYELEVKNTYPALHPYAHTVIGSMDDLNAASLDDVKAWFATYYGPSNATLVLAGDITTAAAHQMVEKYFGAIPPGPPVAHQDAWVAKMTGLHLQHVQDRVAQPMIDSLWNIPQYGTADSDYLDVASDILGLGKTSRLYKKLVYEMQLATNASARISRDAIGGQFTIEVLTKPDADLKVVETAIHSILQEFLRDGPTAEELERVKVKDETDQIDTLETVSEQASTLAQAQVFTGDPNRAGGWLDHVRAATAAQVKDAANRWLSDGEYRLEVVPFPKLAASTAQDVDRSKLPEIGQAEPLRMPKLERMTLKNGLQVVLAERHEMPLINMQMIVKAGFASDFLATPGTASMTSELLMDGTEKYNSLQLLNDQVERLGITASAAASVDTSTVYVAGLVSKLKPALSLLSEIVQHPSFTEDEIARQKKLQLAYIEQGKTRATSVAYRVLPPLLFGDKHPYSTLLTGTGEAASVEKLQRADLARFHDEWYRPNNATLVVVGDTTLEQIKPLLEEAFGSWKPQTVPTEKIPQVPAPVGHGLYVIDQPGSQQSLLIAATIAPPQNSPDEVALEMWNNILSGSFTGRLNMNLREDKHWSYGTQSYFVPTMGQRPYVVVAQVQTDKTRESLIEMEKEALGIVGSRPPSEMELQGTVEQETKRLPGSRESSSSVSFTIQNIISYHLPEDFYTSYAAKAEALQPAAVEAAAKEFFHPDQLVWIVVGDRAKIEDSLKQLDLGPVQWLDADGHPIK